MHLWEKHSQRTQNKASSRDELTVRSTGGFFHDVFVSRRSCVECHLKAKDPLDECALKCNSLHATVSNSTGQNPLFCSMRCPFIGGHMVSSVVVC